MYKLNFAESSKVYQKEQSYPLLNYPCTINDFSNINLLACTIATYVRSYCSYTDFTEFI